MADIFGDFEDPSADFLAREQEILGEDAALFGQETTALPFVPVNPPTQDSVPVVPPFPPTTSPVSFQNVPNAVKSSDWSSPTQQQAPITREPEVEPPAIRAWKEQFKQTVADRDAKSKAKHALDLKAAKDALDKFYAEYNEKKKKSILKNKDGDKSVKEDKVVGSNVWDQTLKLIDQVSTSSALSAKEAKLKGKQQQDDKKEKSKKSAKDTSRMKNLLMSLKNDKNAPGLV